VIPAPSTRAAVATRPRRVLSLVLAWSLVGASVLACDSTVTERDLEKWTNNDLGLARIAEVVANPRHPMDTRVRALEVMVEKGFPLRVRHMVDAIDDDADRDEVVRRIAEQLLKHVTNRSEAQFDAKDAIMTLQAYLPEETFDVIRQTVAEWAFHDLTWDTPGTEVQSKIQSRISSGQITDLGRYGWEVAGILISHGFVVDRMVRYLGSAEDASATAVMLRGVRTLHARIGAQGYHIDALRSTGRAAALAYLLEMYLNTELDREFRAAAFNVAVQMMELESVKREPRLVVEQLFKLLAMPSPEDRWLGLSNLIHLTGTEHLERALEAFDEEIDYRQAQEDPAKSIMDVCLDLHDLGHAERANAIFSRLLHTGNRIVKALAIVCLKANLALDARADLQLLAARAGGNDDASVDDLLGEGLTLGRLAQNALEGLAMLEALQGEVAQGEYEGDAAKTRRLLIIFPLELTGDEYRAAVEQRFAAWKAEQEALQRQRETDEEAAEEGGATPEGAGEGEGGTPQPQDQPAPEAPGSP